MTSPRIAFDFLDYGNMPDAFRAFVRGEAEIDLCEIAIVTHLLAMHFRKPITGLAIPLWGRLPQANLVCPADSPIQGPKDLEGKRVGVRAYAQTSGVWIRGIITEEYGIDLDSITWVTMEDSHLAEFQDPPICERNRSDLALRPLMMAGDLAAIMGERVVDPAGVRSVIPDAEAVARNWIERNGVTPINHTVAVKSALLDAHPWLAGALMELFTEARRVAIEEDGAEAPPEYGLEACRAALDLAFSYCADQRIAPRRMRADELYLPL